MSARIALLALATVCCLALSPISEVRAQSGPELASQVTSWDRARLESEAVVRRATVEGERDVLATKRDALLEAGDDATLKAEVAVQAAVLDTAAKDLRIVINALEAQGGDVASYRALLIQVQGARDLDDLDASALMVLVTGWADDGKTWLVDNAPGLIVKAVVFVVVLLLFRLLAAIAARLVRSTLSSSRLKVTDLLRNFFVGITRNIVFLVGVMFAFSAIGTDLTPILAGFGIFGFVVGFALQDTLGNFAAGLMILLYRPFDVGHVVEAGGVTGKVADLSLVNTTMLTPDNQKVIVPNGKIWGGTIRNITANPTRRVDMTLGVSYADDLDLAKRVITEVVTANPLVLADPAPTIEVANLGDSSVDFVVRPWCQTGDYWTVHFELTKALKEACDKAGLSIPFPQRDVHLHQVASASA